MSMKKLIIISSIVSFFAACTNDNKVKDPMQKALTDSTNFTTISWSDTLIDFGSHKQGEKVEVKFHCKNTGSKPLVLANVSPTCGCTIADYTKEPIAPSKEGLVTAVFNSDHFCGNINKTIIATANTKPTLTSYLKFTGNITDCKSDDKVVIPHEVPAKKDTFLKKPGRKD
ncbi:MAG: hypothetical protein C0459_10930 [Chitinophaga sp.]|jgi:Protein of unknown function (DUF1573)|nr:hypothetical protein [Chitinophaga sp.]